MRSSFITLFSVSCFTHSLHVLPRPSFSAYVSSHRFSSLSFLPRGRLQDGLCSRIIVICNCSQRGVYSRPAISSASVELPPYLRLFPFLSPLPPPHVTTTIPLSSCYLSTVNRYWWVHSFTLPLQHLPATCQPARILSLLLSLPLTSLADYSSLSLTPSILFSPLSLFSHFLCLLKKKKKKFILSFCFSIIWQSHSYLFLSFLYHLRLCCPDSKVEHFLLQHTIRFILRMCTNCATVATLWISQWLHQLIIISLTAANCAAWTEGGFDAPGWSIDFQGSCADLSYEPRPDWLLWLLTVWKASEQ